jgi:hypothetical protein
LTARRLGLEAGGLVVALLALTLALGLGFGGVGLSGISAASGPSGQGSSHLSTNGAYPAFSPRVIIRAEGVNPFDLYLYNLDLYNDHGLHNSSSLNLSSPVLPQSMYVPLSGLRVTLTQLQKSSVSIRGQSQTQVLTTNSAGLALTFVLPGNYTVLFSGPNFEFETNIFFASGFITTVNFMLNPVAKAVTALRIVSPDSVSGVESETKLYALFNSSSPPASGFAELVGFNPNSFLWEYGWGMGRYDQFNLNATVLGWHASAHGFWVALAPLGPYPSYPSLDVVLFQYKPVYEVTYTVP